MSSKGFHGSSRKSLPLDEIYGEVMEHMKTVGHYDAIRTDLIERIWTDSKINAIKDTFVTECKAWCEQVDLSQPRNQLRAKLATRFDSDSTNFRTSRFNLKKHVTQFLQDNKEEIRAKYYEHAREFCQRYLPKPSPSPEDVAFDNKVDIEEPLKQRTPEPAAEEQPVLMKPEELKQELEEQQALREELQADLDDMDMDIESLSPRDDDEEIEKPPYSPIGNSDDDMDLIQEPNMTTPRLDEIPIPPMDESPRRLSPSNQPPNIKEENSEIPEEDLSQLDDDDKDTFSEISTVDTADLSDFDNSICLSDVEATVIGKPGTTKQPYKEIHDQIQKVKNDLANTNMEIKTEPEPLEVKKERSENPEPLEGIESDGGCSESTITGGRSTRTRKPKPNSRFSDYIQ